MNRTTRLLLFSLLVLVASCATLSRTAPPAPRYLSPVFTHVDSVSGVRYGEAVNVKGVPEQLLLDLYTPPPTDTVTKRPLVIYIHGGGFQSNTRKSRFIAHVCTGLAQRGYVAASIDYRLGIREPKGDSDYFEAMYRAVQDGKAAVRFFRKHAALYGIDTSQVFVAGQSAGAKTALHMAYLDKAEVPPFIDTTVMGTLEGGSGNEGYSSRVHGVVNCWGAMIDYRWINRGDVPLFNVSGTADKTVPFDSSFAYHGFRYGSAILYQRARSLGIPSGLRLFYGAGHTLDNNRVKQDSAFLDMAQWLYTRLKTSPPARRGAPGPEAGR